MADQEVTETNEEVADVSAEAPEVVEEETQDELEQEEVETEEEEDQQVEETPEVSRRMEKRAEKLAIGNLIAAKKREIQQQQATPGMDYRKTLEADDATVGQLEADRRQYGDTLYQQGVQQAESIQFTTRLEIDAPKIEAKYPQLDKDSDRFDPVIADALNTHYLNLVGYDATTNTVQNPSLRYRDFIEAQFELAGALANDQTSRTTKNIARQAATTGLRPGGNSTKRLNLNQDPAQMNDEELDAIIAQAIPKK